MKVINLLVLLVVPYFTYGQNVYSDCRCPLSQYTGTKADTIFQLSDNHKITLCGGTDASIIKGKILFTEFVLSVCGSNKIIKFWDATQFCNVKLSADTLMVETMMSLPVGKAMSYKETVWTIEHFYFHNGKLERYTSINKLPKYNKLQVAYVLKLYRTLPNDNSEKVAELADKLLVCVESNSKEAEAHLINFRKRFTYLDGETMEEYDSTLRMFKQWQKFKSLN